MYGHVGYAGAGSDAESIRTVHRALELGITFLDTAEIYGPLRTRSWSAERSPDTGMTSCCFISHRGGEPA
ncbi:aryl-alcohol dehydrogenase-like predicted oxidoreductase [Mycobacterium sp. URHB0021]